MSAHVCTCSRCAVAPFDDRCRFELQLEQARERLGAAESAAENAAEYDVQNAYKDALEILAREPS